MCFCLARVIVIGTRDYLKPVLGGVTSIALFTTGHKQTNIKIYK